MDIHRVDSTTSGFKNNPFAHFLKDWQPAASPIPDKRLALKGERPHLLQLRITVDPDRRLWECYAGAAGAGKYLNHFTGRIPHAAVKAGAARVNTYALNEASRAALKRFKGAQVVSIDLDPQNVNSPIARLEMGIAPPRGVERVRGARWAA